MNITPENLTVAALAVFIITGIKVRGKDEYEMRMKFMREEYIKKLEDRVNKKGKK